MELAGDSAGEVRRENLFSAGEAVRREREELNKFNGFAASSRLVRPFLTFYWLREILREIERTRKSLRKFVREMQGEKRDLR